METSNTHARRKAQRHWGAALFFLGLVLLAAVGMEIFIARSGNAVVVASGPSDLRSLIFADEFGWTLSEPRQRIGVFVEVGEPFVAGDWARPSMVVGGVVYPLLPMPCFVERSVSIRLTHNAFDGDWTAFAPEHQAQFLREHGETLAEKFTPNQQIYWTQRRINGSTDLPQLVRRALASGRAEYIDRRVLWPNIPANLIAWLPAPVRFPLAISFVVVGGALWFVGRRRFAVGACVRCGYDLSGTPGADRCPECGGSTRELNRAGPTAKGK